MGVTLPNSIVNDTPHDAVPVMNNFAALRDAYNGHVHKGTGSDAPPIGFADIANKPASYPPSAHTHVGGDVTSAVAEATHADNATNSDKVDSCDAGTGPNNVLKLDSSGKVPTGNLPGGVFVFAQDAPYYGTIFRRTETDTDYSTWFSVGPTGSGATVVWTALDSVPSGAKGVRLNMTASVFHGSAATQDCSIGAKVRKTGSSVNPIGGPIIAAADLSQEEARDSNTVDVQIDNYRRFDFYWYRTLPSGAIASVDVYLEGWYL